MQLLNIPKFQIGSPVELKTLWKRATVYKSTWNKEANQYAYFLVGEDINPLAPYKESILVAGVPQTPNFQAQYEGIKYRIYLDCKGVNYAYRLWEDGKFIHNSAYNFVQKADARNAALHRLSKVLIAQEAS